MPANLTTEAFPAMDESLSSAPAEAGFPAKTSAWSHSRGKRVLDFVVAGSVLLVCLPVMGLVAVIVALTSSGPILFRQFRSGEGGLKFELLKFRTMTVQQSSSAPGVTRQGDARITPVGRVLRNFKLDELPQLVNVVRGDMSLVGPRPDLPHFLEALAPEYRELLTLKPGLTGAATVEFRHEEQLLAAVPQDQLLNYYTHTVLPQKARLDLAYAGQSTFSSDLQILWRTARALFE
jgi:lipopolysaccharide/colanic/teichoic acid biosynthesis glycosyltransferase